METLIVEKTVNIQVSEAPLPPEGNAVLTGKALWLLPIPQALVSLNDQKTVTDLSGTFQVTVPVGTYTLKVEHLFFEPHEETLYLPEEETYEITVKMKLKLQALWENLPTWQKIALVSAGVGGVAGVYVLRR